MTKKMNKEDPLSASAARTPEWSGRISPPLISHTSLILSRKEKVPVALLWTVLQASPVLVVVVTVAGDRTLLGVVPAPAMTSLWMVMICGRVLLPAPGTSVDSSVRTQGIVHSGSSM